MEGNTDCFAEDIGHNQRSVSKLYWKNRMAKLFNLGKGYLTYFMAAVSILYGVLGLVSGQVDKTQAETAIWAGLALFGIRRAIQ